MKVSVFYQKLGFRGHGNPFSVWPVTAVCLCVVICVVLCCYGNQVRNHIWVFVNCLIENPSFDSQTKDNMTLQAKSFGSKCALSDKMITAVSPLVTMVPKQGYHSHNRQVVSR